MNKPPGEKNLRKKKYRAILAPAPLLACPSLWNQCISWRTESASTGPPPALLWPSSGTPYLMTAWGWGARHSLLGEGKESASLQQWFQQKSYVLSLIYIWTFMNTAFIYITYSIIHNSFEVSIYSRLRLSPGYLYILLIRDSGFS